MALILYLFLFCEMLVVVKLVLLWLLDPLPFLPLHIRMDGELGRFEHSNREGRLLEDTCSWNSLPLLGRFVLDRMLLVL
jgi:hypothetical protein